MNTQNKSVQNSGHITQEQQNITFFMVLNTVGRMTDSIGPYFETQAQAEAFLDSIADRYEDAFVVQYTSFAKHRKERSRLLAQIVQA